MVGPRSDERKDKKKLDTLIEEGVQYMKEYLSQNKNLLGYEDDYIKVNFVNELQREIE